MTKKSLKKETNGEIGTQVLGAVLASHAISSASNPVLDAMPIQKVAPLTKKKKVSEDVVEKISEDDQLQLAEDDVGLSDSLGAVLALDEAFDDGVTLTADKSDDRGGILNKDDAGGWGWLGGLMLLGGIAALAGGGGGSSPAHACEDYSVLSTDDEYSVTLVSDLDNVANLTVQAVSADFAGLFTSDDVSINLCDHGGPTAILLDALGDGSGVSVDIDVVGNADSFTAQAVGIDSELIASVYLDGNVDGNVVLDSSGEDSYANVDLFVSGDVMGNFTMTAASYSADLDGGLIAASVQGDVTFTASSEDSAIGGELGFGYCADAGVIVFDGGIGGDVNITASGLSSSVSVVVLSEGDSSVGSSEGNAISVVASGDQSNAGLYFATESGDIAGDVNIEATGDSSLAQVSADIGGDLNGDLTLTAGTYVSGDAADSAHIWAGIRVQGSLSGDVTVQTLSHLSADSDYNSISLDLLVDGDLIGNVEVNAESYSSDINLTLDVSGDIHEGVALIAASEDVDITAAISVHNSSDITGGVVLTADDANDSTITATINVDSDLRDLAEEDLPAELSSGVFDIDLTSNRIQDGRDDAYDGGNYLNSQFEEQMSYSATLVDGSATSGFGVGSQYVTFKTDNVFGLLVSGNQSDTFDITGNLGADGGGEEDLLELGSYGDYTAVVQRTFNANDPSINRLFIYQNNSSVVVQELDYETQDDDFNITGLSDVDTFAYLVLFGDNDQPLLEEELLSFFEAYVDGVLASNEIAAALNAAQSFNYSSYFESDVENRAIEIIADSSDNSTIDAHITVEDEIGGDTYLAVTSSDNVTFNLCLDVCGDIQGDVSFTTDSTSDNGDHGLRISTDANLEGDVYVAINGDYTSVDINVNVDNDLDGSLSIINTGYCNDINANVFIDNDDMENDLLVENTGDASYINMDFVINDDDMFGDVTVNNFGENSFVSVDIDINETFRGNNITVLNGVTENNNVLFSQTYFEFDSQWTDEIESLTIKATGVFSGISADIDFGVSSEITGDTLISANALWDSLDSSGPTQVDVDLVVDTMSDLYIQSASLHGYSTVNLNIDLGDPNVSGDLFNSYVSESDQDLNDVLIGDVHVQGGVENVVNLSFRDNFASNIYLSGGVDIEGEAAEFEGEFNLELYAADQDNNYNEAAWINSINYASAESNPLANQFMTIYGFDRSEGGFDTIEFKNFSYANWYDYDAGEDGWHFSDLYHDGGVHDDLQDFIYSAFDVLDGAVRDDYGWDGDSWETYDHAVNFYFGTVGNDGYLAVDNDGTDGISYLIKFDNYTEFNTDQLINTYYYEL